MKIIGAAAGGVQLNVPIRMIGAVNAPEPPPDQAHFMRLSMSLATCIVSTSVAFFSRENFSGCDEFSLAEHRRLIGLEPERAVTDALDPLHLSAVDLLEAFALVLKLVLRRELHLADPQHEHCAAPGILECAFGGVAGKARRDLGDRIGGDGIDFLDRHHRAGVGRSCSAQRRGAGGKPGEQSVCLHDGQSIAGMGTVDILTHRDVAPAFRLLTNLNAARVLCTSLHARGARRPRRPCREECDGPFRLPPKNCCEAPARRRGRATCARRCASSPSTRFAAGCSRPEHIATVARTVGEGIESSDIAPTAPVRETRREAWAGLEDAVGHALHAVEIAMHEVAESRAPLTEAERERILVEIAEMERSLGQGWEYPRVVPASLGKRIASLKSLLQRVADERHAATGDVGEDAERGAGCSHPWQAASCWDSPRSPVYLPRRFSRSGRVRAARPYRIVRTAAPSNAPWRRSASAWLASSRR